ncbi:MAG: lysylphosphatidylglycerol synthase domain-containing protein [Planctomycetota bacterium]
MKLLVSLAVAVLAIALLLRWGGISAGEIGEALARIDVATFALALAIQASIYVFRAARLQVLLRASSGTSAPLPDLVAASAAWILDSHVLPAKVGEATLVVHLARVGVKPEHGLVGLLLSRLLDLATLVAILGIACVVTGASGAHPDLPWLVGLGGILLAAALALALAILRGGHVIGLARRTLVRLGLERTLVGARASRFAGRVEAALHAAPKSALRTAALLSLPVWAAVLGVYAVLGTGVGLTGLSAFDLVFGSSLAILGSLVPINGFLGFGMLDMGWAWGFAAVGVPEDRAVATGLAFHTLYVVGVGLLGALGHARLVGRGQRTKLGPKSS